MTPRRLAVYTDYAYTIRDGSVFAERAFALFMSAVLEHADEGTIIGRLQPAGGHARYALPATTRFVALPYYPDGSRLGSVAKALVSSARAMWRSLDSVDVVWVLGPHGLAVPFALLALTRRRQLRLGVRQDLRRYARSRHPGRPAVHRLADVLEFAYRVLARRYPMVVVGEDLARNYGGGVALLTTSVSLVREAEIVDPGRAVATSWDGRLEILSVGRVDTEKNPLLLVDIVRGLVELDPRWHLIICGEGPLLDAVTQRAAEQGVREHIDLRGYVPFAELGALYRSSHVFLHVSLTEGVPQVLFEAFAAGLAVVATDVGGVRVAVGDAAALIAPESAAEAVDAVATLRRDPQQRRRRIEAGLRIAKRHTLEHEAATVAGFLLDGVDSPVRRFAARLPPPLQALGGRTVLDLRCGEGETALLMAELGAAEVLGVDTRDLTTARLNRQRADPALGARVRFQHVDGATWTPPAQAYDLVVLRDDFTGEPDRLLDWARRAAAPDGSVAIEFRPGRVTLREFADAMARSRLHCTWYQGSGRHGPIVSVWGRPLDESRATAPLPDLAALRPSP